MWALGKRGAGRGTLWLGIAACLLIFALMVSLSHRLAALGFAALGAMLAFRLAVILPDWLVRWKSRLRRAFTAVRRTSGMRFEDLPVPLILFSAEGVVIAANAAAREMLGEGPDRSMAHDLFEDLGRPVADWLRDVATGRHPGGSEVLRMRKVTEAKSYVQITARRAGEDDVLAVLQDATAMKRLEAQFTQSQKMQAIGQLAGGIAHDFNNLLTAITGHCELLLLRHRADDPDHEDLQQIQQNAYRAGALVKQLLAFSRKQTLVPEQIDLTEVLGQLAHLLNRLLAGAVRLDLDYAPAPLVLRVDKGQFEQVIINLAVNARDAMPAGGTLRIRTDHVTLEKGMQRDRVTVPAGRYAVIHLADTGSGIDPAILGQIFEPFFTTKRTGEGTGLGLSTVYGIVKQSGGFIFVDSTPGEGTEFQLWFPACAEAETEIRPVLPTRSKASLLGASEGVVLLVEDEVPVRAFAARALRLRGLTVLEAESGEQALDVAGRALKIDLIVSDVILPGLNGPEWVEQALQSRPGTPVIFISGYAGDQPAEAQSRIPNSVFLSKPFSLAELSEAVATRLPRRATLQLSEVLSVS